jgi:hypothetical protein
MKILLGDFVAKVGREVISKPTVWNDNLHKISNDNGVRVVNFCHIQKYKKYKYKNSIYSLIFIFIVTKF